MSRFPTFRRVPLTLALTLVLVLIYEVTWMVGGDAAVSAFASRCSAWRVSEGAWWTILASGLVHGDWHHLVVNASGILAFGLWLEPRLGTKRLAVLIIAAELASSAASLLLESKAGSGASGVGFALAGACIGRPIWTGVDGLRYYSGIWLVFVYITAQWYTGGADAAVSHAGHLGGLLTGLLAGAFPWREDVTAIPMRGRLMHAGALVFVVLAMVGIETMNPRWLIVHSWKQAKAAAAAGDFAAADARWRDIASVCDPASRFDARFIELAATYQVRRSNDAGAIDLLKSVAPTWGTARSLRNLGFLMKRGDSSDEREVLEVFRSSFLSQTDQPDVVNAMAEARIFGSDTSLYDPMIAIRLARMAISMDRMQEGWYMRTLAHAHFEIDEYGPAFRWMDLAMRRAVSSEDSLGKATFEADIEWMREWVRDNPPNTTAASHRRTRAKDS